MRKLRLGAGKATPAHEKTDPGLSDLASELPTYCLSPSTGEKRIYRVPVFTVPFCQALLEELEHFEQSDMPKGRPNTMNNYGVGEAWPLYPPEESRQLG